MLLTIMKWRTADPEHFIGQSDEVMPCLAYIAMSLTNSL